MPISSNLKWLKLQIAPVLQRVTRPVTTHGFSSKEKSQVKAADAETVSRCSDGPTETSK